MKRRGILLLLGGAMTASRGPHAEQKTMLAIGYFNGGSPGPSARIVAAFRRELSETG